GGLVDAAVLVPVRALVVLLVRGLSAVEGVVGAVFLGTAGAERPAATAALAAREGRTLGQLHFHDFALRIIAEGELHLVAGRVIADFLQEIVVRFDRRLADRDDDVLFLESSLIRGSAFNDGDDARAGAGVFALQTEVGPARAGDLLFRRRAHADLFAIDDRIDDARIFQIPVESDAAERIARQ